MAWRTLTDGGYFVSRNIESTGAGLVHKNGFTAMAWAWNLEPSDYSECGVKIRWDSVGGGTEEGWNVYGMFDSLREIQAGFGQSTGEPFSTPFGIDFPGATWEGWIHLAFTVSQPTTAAAPTGNRCMTAYINGKEARTAGEAGSIPTAAYYPIIYWAGGLQDSLHAYLRVWRRALTPAEIQEEMRSRYAVNARDLVADMSFNSYLDDRVGAGWTETINFGLSPMFPGVVVGGTGRSRFNALVSAATPQGGTTLAWMPCGGVFGERPPLVIQG